MRQEKRAVEIRKLDEKQKLYRRASEANRNHGPWLREVRQALGISAVETARKLGVGRETIFRFERRERDMSTSLEKLDLLAHAMGCKLTYSIVPVKGTLAELAEVQAWRKRVKREDQPPPAEPWKKAKAAKPAPAAAGETPEEMAKKMEDLVNLIEKAGPMGTKRTETPMDETTEGMTAKELSFRRMLARMEAQPTKNNEALRQLTARQIEGMRREREGGPPLETAEEREARLRKAIEEARRRPKAETPKAEPVELRRFTLEEAEGNIKVFERLLERKTQGPEKGTPEEIVNLERAKEWFQRIVEEGKREAEAEGGAATG